MNNIKNTYVSYADYYLNFNTEEFTLTAGFEKECFKAKLESEILDGYDNCQITKLQKNSSFETIVCYTKGSENLKLVFNADYDGISIKSVYSF